MIKVLILLCLLALGLALGPQLAGNKGYVLIAFNDYTIEMSVTSAIFFLFILFCALVFSLWLLRIIWLSISRSGNWWGRQRRHRAQSHTQQGLMAMMKGDYQHAEKLVSKAAQHSELPALNYLTAAEAAANQGQQSKRDAYLEKASQLGDSDEAVLLTQARLQLQQGDHQAALGSLQQLPQSTIDSASAKRLLLQIYPELAMWQQYLDILPSAHKLHLIDSEQLNAERKRSYQALFDALATNDGADKVADYWNRMPRKQKKDALIAATATRALIKAGDSNGAYQLIGSLLTSSADSLLFEVASELELEDPYPLIQQLAKLEKRCGDYPPLLLALAKLYLEQQQLSEAENALSRCLETEPSTKAYQLMAEVKHQQADPEQAVEFYRKALA
ncbi:heme biosynthesis HemY N-terminal domain-containing protein [Aliagarivorans taiwanensis]|uniref:heme biosynthesis HemY N-terminal domain-containing protein n=1 Tax=Aliagarivorans taiwanensis TaxID=561966 RepID=UPI0003F8DDC8|nr:heme biosynthesis HemY N-terminal domain-containing protein [Aliagarivorans taiwanensis]